MKLNVQYWLAKLAVDYGADTRRNDFFCLLDTVIDVKNRKMEKLADVLVCHEF